MSEDDETPLPSRVGSSADLARRMDRIESRHETLEGEVRTLSQTVSRVETNQVHAADLNRLRFDALEIGIKSLTDRLAQFMARVEGLIDGTLETNQTRQGREMVADYYAWRKSTDDRLDSQDVVNGQLKLIGRIITFVVGGNALMIVGAIAYLIANGGVVK